MRVAFLAGIGLLYAAWATHAQTPTAMQYYDQIQGARGKAGNLVDPQHPDAAKLRQAESILKGALDTLAQSEVMELAEGNAALLARRYDTLRDLAGVYALEGRKGDALDALDAMQAEAWIPSTASLLRTDSEFASLRDEPRFKAILVTLDNADRLWNAKTLTVPYAAQLSEAERIAGLSLFWSEARYNFAHFDHVPELDWDRTYLDFLPQVIAAKDTTAYYEVLMRLAPLLRDGHTNIYPPKELVDHFYARPPMRTALVQGHVLVTQVFSPTLERLGVHVGDEVLAVDGVEVHRYAEERIAPYESSSTPQDADVRAYTYALLSGDKSQPVRLRLQSTDGTTREVEVSRGHYADVQSSPAFAFRMLPGDIAYLSLGHFESDEGVKVFEQHLPEIMKARGLILDVRNNGGGSTSYGLHILSYLDGKPIPTNRSRELEIDTVARAQGSLTLHWRKLMGSGEVYVKQHAQHFDGPVAVLIGPRTFSAAEDFVVSFDAMKRGILVGQRTGGSTGQPLLFKLPGGGSARICAKRDTYPDGREFVGEGIAPDIVVEPTVDDIRAARDGALERAANELRKYATEPRP
jgi:C-terminal processing protease CtpA/Prc